MTSEPQEIASRQAVVPESGVLLLPLLGLQLLGLWLLNFAGVWIVETLGVSIPGNLVGMIGLYLLLSCGLVKLSWFDATRSFLIKHLAFFFIPITVGLMARAISSPPTASRSQSFSWSVLRWDSCSPDSRRRASHA